MKILKIIFISVFLFSLPLGFEAWGSRYSLSIRNNLEPEEFKDARLILKLHHQNEKKEELECIECEQPIPANFEHKSSFIGIQHIDIDLQELTDSEHSFTLTGTLFITLSETLFIRTIKLLFGPIQHQWGQGSVFFYLNPKEAMLTLEKNQLTIQHLRYPYDKGEICGQEKKTAKKIQAGAKLPQMISNTIPNTIILDTQSKE